MCGRNENIKGKIADKKVLELRGREREKDSE